jgi:ComF family protein
MRRQHLRALVHAAGQALSRLDDAVMPLRCVFCGIRTGELGEQLCRGCHADLPWIGNACSGCAAPRDVELPAGVHCARCQARPPPFAATLAPLRYEFPVDAGLKALKFGRRLHYAVAFASLLADHAERRLPTDVDGLLPVPLHPRRLAWRGFNQAHELCRPLAKRLDLPLTNVARRRRATRYQSGLTASERRKNLRDAFVAKGTPAYRHLVLVDDVVTTGETTRQLARVLLEAGVERVSVLAVARAA